MHPIIFDIDTQWDLIYKKSKNVDIQIIKNIEDVLINALRNEIVLIGSVIVYENNLYGYCAVGTVGQEKLNETMMVEPEFYYNVANTRNGIDLNVASECWQIVFEKQGSDIWDPLLGQPDNLQSLLRSEHVDLVYIVGNNFDDSVIYTIEGLIKSKYKVKVIIDAVNWNNNSVYKILVDTLYGIGVDQCITTEDFISEVSGEANG